MTLARIAGCLLALTTVLSLTACANGGMGSQQGNADSQPKAVIPASSGGY